MIHSLAAFFKNNKRELIELLVFLVLFGFSLMLLSGGITDFAASTDLPLWLFILLSIIVFLGSITFIYYEYKYHQTKILYPLVCVMTILFLINLLVVIFTPLDNNIIFSLKHQGVMEFILSISNVDKLVYLFRHVLLLQNIYIAIIYICYHVSLLKEIKWMFYLVLFFVIFAVIFSYFAEFNKYIDFFSHLSETLYGYNPTSIFKERNDYAATLLGGVFASVVLLVIEKKRFFYFFIAFFAVNALFTVSKWSLLLIVVTILALFIYKMIASFSYHKKRNTITISIISAAIITAIIITVSIGSVRDYIYGNLLSGGNTWILRKILWNRTGELTKGIHIVFGNGFGYFTTMFASANRFEVDEHVKSAHNLYVQAYGSGGIILEIALFALIVFFIYKIVKLYKNRAYDSGFISILSMVLFMLYFVMEG